MAEKTTTIVMVARDMASGNIAKVRGELHGLGTAGKVGALGLGGLGLASSKIGGALSHAKSQIGGVVSSLGMLGGALAAGGIVAGIGSATNAAMTFQSSMELLKTQTGATQQEVDSMSKSLLQMASSVGTGPQTLAQGLYHIESAGMRGSKALDMLRIAAEGAKVGGADLESVTNALVGAWQSGVKGADNMSQAMGTVNAIVGAGNMRMQDLASSLESGILASAKTFGASFQSVGAAIATMTDEGIPAIDAATRLRMTLNLLGAPTSKAAKLFKEVGLSSTDLANQMRGPNGLVGAVTTLHEAMVKAGMLDKEGRVNTKGAQFLSGAFGGGRSSSAIMTLVGNYDLLLQKQKAVNDGAAGFGQAWASTTQTAQYKFAQFQAALGTLAVNLGNALLPPLTQFATAAAGFITSNQDSIVNALQGAIGVAETFGSAFKTFVLPPIQMVAHVIGAIPGPIKEAAAALFILQKSSSWLFGSGPLQWGKSLLGSLLGKVPGVGGIASAVAGVQHVWVDNPGFGMGGGAGGIAGAGEAAAGGGLLGLGILGLTVGALADAIATAMQYHNDVQQNKDKYGLTQAQALALKLSQENDSARSYDLRHGAANVFTQANTTYQQALADALAKIAANTDPSNPANQTRNYSIVARMLRDMVGGPGKLSAGAILPSAANMLDLFASSKSPSIRSMQAFENTLKNLERGFAKQGDLASVRELQRIAKALEKLIPKPGSPLPESQLRAYMNSKAFQDYRSGERDLTTSINKLPTAADAHDQSSKLADIYNATSSGLSDVVAAVNAALKNLNITVNVNATSSARDVSNANRSYTRYGGNRRVTAV